MLVLVLGYASSLFEEFETYLRILVGLSEKKIQLILNQCNSSFITNEMPAGFYSSKDISGAVCTMGDNEATIPTEYDDISKKTKNF